MQDRRDADELLEPLCNRLEHLGLPDLALRLRGLMGPIGTPADGTSTSPSDLPADGLVPIADATRLLSLRSPSTVLALVDRRVLEAYECDGQQLISRRSLERLLASPELARQQRIEAQLWSLLGSDHEADA